MTYTLLRRFAAPPLAWKVRAYRTDVPAYVYGHPIKHPQPSEDDGIKRFGSDLTFTDKMDLWWHDPETNHYGCPYCGNSFLRAKERNGHMKPEICQEMARLTGLKLLKRNKNEKNWEKRVIRYLNENPAPPGDTGGGR